MPIYVVVEERDEYLYIIAAFAHREDADRLADTWSMTAHVEACRFYDEGRGNRAEVERDIKLDKLSVVLAR